MEHLELDSLTRRPCALKGGGSTRENELGWDWDLALPHDRYRAFERDTDNTTAVSTPDCSLGGMWNDLSFLAGSKMIHSKLK
jgi:hypothetical protein